MNILNIVLVGSAVIPARTSVCTGQTHGIVTLIPYMSENGQSLKRWAANQAKAQFFVCFCFKDNINLVLGVLTRGAVHHGRPSWLPTVDLPSSDCSSGKTGQLLMYPAKENEKEFVFIYCGQLHRVKRPKREKKKTQEKPITAPGMDPGSLTVNGLALPL